MLNILHIINMLLLIIFPPIVIGFMRYFEKKRYYGRHALNSLLFGFVLYFLIITNSGLVML